MLNLNFSDKYDIVHITPEFGESAVGGICTFINELYSQRDDNWGFIHIHGDNANTITSAMYPNVDSDVLVIGLDELEVLENIQSKTFVIHFYVFAEFLTTKIYKEKNVVFVIHSVPTTEPWFPNNPFGDRSIQKSFETLCDGSKLLICVSYAEKEKLIKLYPQYKDKIQVIHNGMNVETSTEPNTNYKKSRKNFGYIGRIDVRKGVREMIKYSDKHDIKLKIATGHPMIAEMQKILEYINATNSLDKVDFLGWSYGARKENFFKSIDALIIPSLYEPFGYIALEAMKYGVPVISSQNGGLKEILGEDYRYLFNTYDEKSFDKVIRTFINDSNEIVSEQVENLTNRLSNFTVDIMVQNYKKTLNKI